MNGQNADYIWPKPIGKMGQKNDTMAVVDSQARVLGTKNLRVVDVSAFPFLPPGHPQATICKLLQDQNQLLPECQTDTIADALAEKISELMLKS